MKEKSVECKLFKEYLDSMDKFERRRIILKIIEECCIEVSTVNNWKYGNSRIPILAQNKIEEISKKNIFTEKGGVL